MADAFRDLRYSLRTLRRNLSYSTVTILTLAVGMGAATTAVTVADHALFRSLPYHKADRLVTLLESDGNQGRRLASFPVYRDWSNENRSFENISFVRGQSTTLRTDEGAETVLIGYVTPGHFAMMNATPVVGRVFGTDEERSDSGNPIVLSYDFWTRRFGGQRDIVGKTLVLDDGAATVIGVMPRGTTFPTWADAWRPIAGILSTDPALAQRGVRSDSRVIARLRDGVSIEAAQADMNAIAARLASAFPNEAKGWTEVDIVTLRQTVIGNVTTMVTTLTAAVFLGLLIACVNVANLSLVRTTARAREFAVRSALGAGRARIARQLIAESLVIATGAGLLGVLIATWSLSSLATVAPVGLPRATELTLDGRVLVSAIALSILTAVVCGLAPAVHVLRSDIANMLRDRTANSHAPAGRWVQSALTVAQFSLAMILLIGAGLFVQSFRRVQQVDVGFDPSGVTALRLLPPSPRYDGVAAVQALYNQLLDKTSAIPGVDAAAIVNHVPLSNAWIPTRIRVAGRPADSANADAALYKSVSLEYLRVMDIPLLAGRWFAQADMTTRASGVVVSRSVAERYWPDRDPIGQSMIIHKSSQGRPDFGEPVQVQVIGVVGDVRHFGMEANPAPDVYVPFTSEPWPHGVLVVRSSLPNAQVEAAVRNVVQDIDRDIPVGGGSATAGVRPLSKNIETLLSTRRWMMSLVTAFAIGALILATLGIYGVTSYVVSQRTHEMGVRIALGASTADVIRLVLRRGMAHIIAGILVGLAGALALTRLIESMLFGTSPREPMVFVAVPMLLSVVAAIACYLPARRAATVDPVIALRAD